MLFHSYSGRVLVENRAFNLFIMLHGLTDGWAVCGIPQLACAVSSPSQNLGLALVERGTFNKISMFHGLADRQPSCGITYGDAQMIRSSKVWSPEHDVHLKEFQKKDREKPHHRWWWQGYSYGYTLKKSWNNLTHLPAKPCGVSVLGGLQARLFAAFQDFGCNHKIFEDVAHIHLKLYGYIIFGH